MITEPLTCWEQPNASPYPAFIRVLENTYNGRVEVRLSEQGLLSPVAHVEMDRDEARRLFFAAYVALIDPED